MQDEHEDEVNWQAFRYVAGEMSEVEVERFEEQLALDQSAREAVATAAQLAQTVALTESQEPVTLRPALAARSEKRMLRAAVWMGLGAAACLAIVLSAGWLDFSKDAKIASPDDTPPPAMADDEATRLAMSWIETKDELADEANGGQDPQNDLLNVTEDETIAAEMSGDEEIEVETPSWLLLAVREEQGEAAPKEN